MSLSKVYSALAEAYTNMGSGYPLPTAWENRPFNPPSKAPWAQFNFSPNQPDVATLGEQGLDEVRGFAQITLVFPEGTGIAETLSHADAFRAYFWAGRTFTYQGQSVRILSTGRSPGRNADKSFRVSITVNWQAFITRKS
jgi:hypothetical protein